MDVKTVAENAFASIQRECLFDLESSEPKTHMYPSKEDMIDYITVCKAVYDQTFDRNIQKDELERLAHRVRYASMPFPRIPIHRDSGFQNYGSDMTPESMARHIKTASVKEWQKLVTGLSEFDKKQRQVSSVVSLMICYYIRYSRTLQEVADKSVQLTACWVIGDSLSVRYSRQNRIFLFDLDTILNRFPHND